MLILRLLRTVPRYVRNYRLLSSKVPASVDSTKTSMAFNYPEARRDESVHDDYHGTLIPDPYRWLEDPGAEETKRFVDGQNAVTVPYLEACPQREAIRRRVTELWDYPKVSVPFRHGDNYFQYRNTGLQNQHVIYMRRGGLQAEETVFLDPNKFSEDGTVALVMKRFSKDGTKFAYGVSTSGSDWVQIKFKDVETGSEYPETLHKVKFSPLAWLGNELVFYGAYLGQDGVTDGSETDAAQNQKLYCHRVGTDQSEDFVVVEFDDPQLRIQATVSDCGRYLVVTPIKGCKNNLLYVADLGAPPHELREKLTLVPVVTEFAADYDYVTNDGTRFVFRTNRNAPNYKLAMLELTAINGSGGPETPAPAWSDLVPEHDKDVLASCMPINNNSLVVEYIRDVKSVLQLHDLKTGRKTYEFELDVGAVTAVSGEREHTEMFYSFCSFLVPTLIYRADLAGDRVKVELIHTTKVGQIDVDQFQTSQVFYESKDGTRVPMFVVERKGAERDGQRPCLLYAYGGFNISLQPAFSVSRLLFVAHFDGVFALANVRGGGEYGDRWHNAARFQHKQNCFDDFQYAARYLVDQKYTVPSKLTIQGGSNGGLLVAACINQAPQLFGAAVCQVGVLDMLRFHRFTIGYAWKSDYGCSDTADGFRYLHAYSPLHNVRPPCESAVQYPATLLLTADHDDRVVPLHTLKYAAELQAKVGRLPGQTNPLMVRVETRAGHGAGKPTAKLIDELCDIFCFVSRALGIEFKA